MNEQKARTRCPEQSLIAIAQKYVKPRTAKGGAISLEAKVARVTKLLITSSAGGLGEVSKFVRDSVLTRTLRDRIWYGHLERDISISC